MIDRPDPDLAGVAEPDGSLDIPGTAAAQIRDLATNNRLLAEGGGDPDCAGVAKLLDAIAANLETIFQFREHPEPPAPDNVVRMFDPPRPVPPVGGAA